MSHAKFSVTLNSPQNHNRTPGLSTGASGVALTDWLAGDMIPSRHTRSGSVSILTQWVWQWTWFYEFWIALLFQLMWAVGLLLRPVMALKNSLNSSSSFCAPANTWFPVGSDHSTQLPHISATQWWTLTLLNVELSLYFFSMICHQNVQTAVERAELQTCRPVVFLISNVAPYLVEVLANCGCFVRNFTWILHALVSRCQLVWVC